MTKVGGLERTSFTVLVGAGCWLSHVSLSASPRPLHKVLVEKCSSSRVRVACAELLLTKAGQMAKPTSVLEEVNL